MGIRDAALYAERLTNALRDAVPAARALKEEAQSISMVGDKRGSGGGGGGGWGGGRGGGGGGGGHKQNNPGRAMTGPPSGTHPPQGPDAGGGGGTYTDSMGRTWAQIVDAQGNVIANVPVSGFGGTLANQGGGAGGAAAGGGAAPGGLAMSGSGGGGGGAGGGSGQGSPLMQGGPPLLPSYPTPSETVPVPTNPSAPLAAAMPVLADMARSLRDIRQSVRSDGGLALRRKNLLP